jgi:peroxiredoxin
MKKPIAQISAFVAVIAIAVAGYFAIFSAPNAPDVRFTDLNGQSISTADLRGKVVLVNFWATSCVTCVHEMPQIVETYNKYRALGFETIAVAMSYDPPNYVLHYAEKNALPFKVALDTKGDLAKSFGDIRLTPTTFIIDKRGQVVKQYLGQPNFAQLHALLEAKLKEDS